MARSENETLKPVLPPSEEEKDQKKPENPPVDPPASEPEGDTADIKKPAEEAKPPEPDPLFPVSPHAPTLVKVDFSSQDPGAFNRMGFYVALEARDKFKERLSALLSAYGQSVKEKIGWLHSLGETKIGELKAQIPMIDLKIAGLEKELQEHLNEEGTLLEDKASLEQDLTLLKGKLQQAYRQYAEEKRDLVKRRIEGLHDELNILSNKFEGLYQKKKSNNKHYYLEHEKSTAKKMAEFTKIQAIIADKQTQIARHTAGIPGIHHGVFSFLLYVGLAMAGVCGWFFSTYVVSKDIGNADFISFILAQTASFGNQLFQSSTNTLQLVVNFFLVLLAVLALIGLVAFICHKLVERVEGKGRRPQNWQKSRLNLAIGEGENMYQTQIGANSFFSFWLQAIPFLLILGIVFIIVSAAGIKDGEVSTIMDALSGQVIGTSIALGVSACMFVYLIFIIEPRIEKLRQKMAANEKASFFLRHWELSLAVLVFLLSLLAFSLNLVADKDVIVIICFSSMVLLTGFGIAYALRFKGLVETERRLMMDSRNVAEALSFHSSPRPVNMHLDEEKRFRKHYQFLNDQLHELMANQSEKALAVLNDRPARRITLQRKKPAQAPQQRNFFSFIRVFFPKNQPEAEAPEQINIGEEISKVDMDYFPEWTFVIKDLGKDYLEKKQELKKKLDYIEALKKRQTDRYLKLAREMDELTARKLNLRQSIEQQKQEVAEKEASLLRQQAENETSLKEGFDLGRQYLQEGLGPDLTSTYSSTS